jgi:hypothetical protein
MVAILSITAILAVTAIVAIFVVDRLPRTFRAAFSGGSRDAAWTVGN